MKRVIARYRELLGDRTFWLAVVVAFLFLLISFATNYEAGLFATRNISNSVTDVILDNVRVRDVDGLYLYGPMVFWAFVTVLLLCHPKKIPYAVKSIAVFVIIRSAFISLTHIAPFSGQVALPESEVNEWFTFGGDLFFSGHTGLPFLLALLFWHDRPLRYIFLVTSGFFGTVVLLGHYHYSIDVFAAFFITYSIAAICRTIFKKDHEAFMASTIAP